VGVEHHSYVADHVLLCGIVRMPQKRAAVSRQPADAISEVLTSKNSMSETCPQTPLEKLASHANYKNFKKKLGSVMHAALPYLCPSNYPTLATPLFLSFIASFANAKNLAKCSSCTLETTQLTQQQTTAAGWSCGC